jgi:DnaJ-class molecular chaperone
MEVSGEIAPGDEAPPEEPSSGENVCPQCGGSGSADEEQCPNCGGTGFVIEAVGGG